MRFDIDTLTPCPCETRIGNVYPVKGGYGTKAGHLMVLLAITQNDNCLLAVIDKQGTPVGITSYSLSHMDERMPTAFCEGLDNLTFRIRSL